MPGIMVDASEQAQNLDMDLPVGLTYDAARILNPTGFLQDLGISIESRIENLLTLVKARIQPDKANQEFSVSLCLAQGPLITERIVTFAVSITQNNEETPSIIITSLPDNPEDWKG
jgi:hypothetical protein